MQNPASLTAASRDRKHGGLTGTEIRVSTTQHIVLITIIRLEGLELVLEFRRELQVAMNDLELLVLLCELLSENGQNVVDLSHRPVRRSWVVGQILELKDIGACCRMITWP